MFDQLDPLVLFVLVLPGILSLKMMSVLQPTKSDELLKNQLMEALAFGVFNAAFWILVDGDILTALSDPTDRESHKRLYGLLGFLAIFCTPLLWATMLHLILVFAEGQGWIVGRHKEAFDDFFSRRPSCWIMIYMKDGSQILGYFGDQSYATSYPNSGHLYLEKIVALDAFGAPAGIVEGSMGVVVNRDQYSYIEITDVDKEDIEENGNG